MNKPRHWKIVIPVKPKAVQAVRGGRRGFYADKKVLAWKDSIRPYIRKACKGLPSKLPIRAMSLRYIFKLPQTAPPHIVKFVEQGGYVPYLMQIDITDNLSKGVIDVCKGIVCGRLPFITQRTSARRPPYRKRGTGQIPPRRPDIYPPWKEYLHSDGSANKVSNES